MIYTIELERSVAEEASIEIEAKSVEEALRLAQGLADNEQDCADLDWEFLTVTGGACVTTSADELRQERG